MGEWDEAPRASRRVYGPRERACYANTSIVAVTDGVIGAWLRNETTGSLSSWQNILNPALPALQAESARRPVGNADGSITFDGGDDLLLSVQDGQTYHELTYGVILWFKPSSVTGFQRLYSVINIGNPEGSSHNAFVLRTSNATLQLEVWADGTNGRRGTTGNVLSVGTPVMIGAFFNGALGTEAARQVVTVGTAAQGMSFINLGGGGTITNLTPAVTGNLAIGSGTGANIAIQNGGVLGRNLFPLVGAMSGATSGLLTPAGLSAFNNFEPLT